MEDTPHVITGSSWELLRPDCCSLGVPSSPLFCPESIEIGEMECQGQGPRLGHMFPCKLFSGFQRARSHGFPTQEAKALGSSIANLALELILLILQ